MLDITGTKAVMTKYAGHIDDLGEEKWQLIFDILNPPWIEWTRGPESIQALFWFEAIKEFGEENIIEELKKRANERSE